MILLQAADSGNPFGMILMLGMFVVMYFFFIRPQQKKQKQQIAFEKELERGKEVVMGAGIIGKISKVDGDIVTLALDNKTTIRILKTAISNEMTSLYEKGKESGDEKK